MSPAPSNERLGRNPFEKKKPVLKPEKTKSTLATGPNAAAVLRTQSKAHVAAEPAKAAPIQAASDETDPGFTRDFFMRDIPGATAMLIIRGAYHLVRKLGSSSRHAALLATLVWAGTASDSQAALSIEVRSKIVGIQNETAAFMWEGHVCMVDKNEVPVAHWDILTSGISATKGFLLAIPARALARCKEGHPS